MHVITPLPPNLNQQVRGRAGEARAIAGAGVGADTGTDEAEGLGGEQRGCPGAATSVRVGSDVSTGTCAGGARVRTRTWALERDNWRQARQRVRAWGADSGMEAVACGSGRGREGGNKNARATGG